ncbi:MAG: DUF2784 domain-containing protein [Deltaproteobacteria bacterium]|nr:DUF2784 domain-containing protein [Deltaproteobacteria bacterium]MBI3076461.1 DUF2784 domain-containing protein [Deltaproteobacteria bacterium]
MPQGLSHAAAVLVMLVHLGWILFNITGALWLRRRHLGLRLLHGTSLGAALVMQSLGIECPLTTLEQEFLRRAGRSSYSGSFITHYLGAIIYPDVPFVLVRILTVVIVAGTLYLYLSRPRPRQAT